MTDQELKKINEERFRRRLPPLSRAQAEDAARYRRAADEARGITRSNNDNGFDVGGFMFGYLTGIPMASPGGIMGAAMHTTSPAYSATDPSPSPSFSNSADSGSSFDSGSSGGSFDGGGSL